MNTKERMIRPDQVVKAAERKEKENLRFRSFLKRVADPTDLDRRFLRLHKQFFQHYDCTQCRNCCKLFHAEIPAEDIDRDAALLNMSRDTFIAEHLDRGDFGEWTEKHLPCGFLNKDGSCNLGDCQPDSCKKFPYTDQPERLFSLYSVLNAVSVCPVAYEIYEALKKEYDFDSRKRGARRKSYFPEENSDFSFIAGYTFGGFPYGVPREPESEDEENENDSSGLPF